MNSTIPSTVFALALAVSATGAPVAATNAVARGQAQQARTLAMSGGFIDRPGSMKGSIAFVDTQDKVAVDKAFNEIFGGVTRLFPVKVELVKSAPDKVENLKAKHKANFWIVFTYDPAAPSLTLWPDDKAAVVNFAKYGEALKLPADQAVYERRCARGALRAFLLLCGGGGSHYPGHAGTVQKPAELDFVHEKIPHDLQDAMKRYLEAAGVTTLRRSSYKKACQEGWAPAPTNEYQKAIWDKVHQLPTKPIKILPETKKVKD